MICSLEKIKGLTIPYTIFIIYFSVIKKGDKKEKKTKKVTYWRFISRIVFSTYYFCNLLFLFIKKGDKKEKNHLQNWTWGYIWRKLDRVKRKRIRTRTCKQKRFLRNRSPGDRRPPQGTSSSYGPLKLTRSNPMLFR